LKKDEEGQQGLRAGDGTDVDKRTVASEGREKKTSEGSRKEGSQKRGGRGGERQ